MRLQRFGKVKFSAMDSGALRYARWWALIALIGLCSGMLFAGAFAAAQDQKTNGQKSKQDGGGTQKVEADTAQGRQVFESRCVGCHGLDGRGGERAPDIATSAKTQGRSDSEIFGIVAKGVPDGGMPAFGSLGDRDIEALISYVRQLQGKNQAARVPGDGTKGRGLFYGKAKCSQCHMVAGSGGFLGADLSTYGGRRSAEEIRQAITKPTSNRSGGTMQVTTRDGRTYSGIVRNEDNFSIQLQTADGEFHLFVKSELERFARTPKSLMPTDYGSTLSASELNDLVSFLMLSAAGQNDPTSHKESKGDEEEE
jgi:cytochrome c oxidase cbb3-type subunit 3